MTVALSRTKTVSKLLAFSINQVSGFNICEVWVDLSCRRRLKENPKEQPGDGNNLKKLLVKHCLIFEVNIKMKTLGNRKHEVLYINRPVPHL